MMWRLAVPLVAVLFASCSGDASDAHSIRLSTIADPATLNPLLARSGSEIPLAKLTFDSLLELDSTGSLIPSLASRVPSLANGDISKDGRTYRFLLRRNVKWHDGVSFSSEDVAFTIRTVLDPKNAIVQRTNYRDISSISTPDERTVVFHLKHVFAPFLTKIGTELPIVASHVFKNHEPLEQNDSNGHPIGTGPFIFDRWERGNVLVYRANHSYFRGSPRIERVDVRILPSASTVNVELMSHHLDFSGVESSQFTLLRTRNDLRSATAPMNQVAAIAMNVTRPALRDVRVRRALVLALDRGAITRRVTNGTGTLAYADLPPSMWTSAHPSPLPFSPERARALLDSAGWRVGANGIRVRDGRTLHLDAVSTSESPTVRSIDAQVVQMWRAVGVDVSYRYSSYRLYFAPASMGGPLARGNYDLADFPYNAGGADPDDSAIFGCANREPFGYNVARYCSPLMERLLADSLMEIDPSRRKARVGRIEGLAASDLPYAFLYYNPKRMIWSRRVHPTPSNLTDYWYDLRNWTLST